MKKAVYFFVFPALILAQAALGDELKLSPALTLKEEFNDNIFLAVIDRKSDFITTISPTIELSERSERSDAGLQLGCNGILYGRTSGLSAVDQSYRGRVAYALSPLTKVSAQTGYTLDSQPNRDIATTGLVIGAVKRHRQSYSLSAERFFTEKTSAGLSYSYQQDDYDDQRFSATRWHTAGLSINHDLDWLMRMTRGSLNLNYAHYSSSSLVEIALVPAQVVNQLAFESEVDNYSISIGGSTAVNELWSIQANVGGRYTLSESRSREQLIIQSSPQSPTQSKQVSSEWGWVGQLALSYKGERTQGSLSFNSDVTPASGQSSGTTVRTGVVASLTRRFSYELSGGVTVGYYLNKSNPGTFSVQTIDDETILISPNIRYEFSRDIYLETFYNYTRVGHNSTASEATQNQFFVKLTFRYPFVM